MKIQYKLTSPLSHIGESASNGSYFQTILTTQGKIPVVTGNSIRGIVRDSGAIHLLDLIGEKVEKETFHVLFSGGNLSNTLKNDLEKARAVRQYFPLISVLGGGLGDMILAGKSSFSFAYPICTESEFITGIKGELSWHKLIEEIEFTRSDDSKDDRLAIHISDIDAESQSKANTQMRYSVQYLAAGTEMIQDIRLTNCTDLEIGSLYAAIKTWFKKRPRIGGMSNKGFGNFDAHIENGVSLKNGKVTLCEEWTKKIKDYEEYILSSDISEKFGWLKGAKKNEKRTNKARESDSDTD